MYQVNIALQDLQAVALMLHRILFPAKMVCWHLDNSIAKTYFCNQAITVCLFLSRPACNILNLADTHGITLIPAYTHVNLNVGVDYLSQRKVGSTMISSSLHSSSDIWCQLEMDLLASHVPVNASVITPWRFSYLWEPWCWILSLMLGHIRCTIFFCHLYQVPWFCPGFWLNMFQVKSDFLTLDAPCWMHVSWLPKVFNMLEDIPHRCTIIKDLVRDISVDQVPKGLQSLCVTLGSSDTCCTDKHSLPHHHHMASHHPIISKVLWICWAGGP